METYTMFMDQKNQYCQNEYGTAGNLQIQCNPYQITNGIFHRTRTTTTKISKFVWRPGTVKAILKKKNRTEGVRLPNFRVYNKATVIKTVWTGTKIEI